MIGCDVIRMETMTLMVFLFVGAIAIQFETYDKAIRDVETGAPGVKNSATPNGADKRCEMREETLESTNKQSPRSPDKAFDPLNPIDALGIALIDFINIFSQLFDMADKVIGHYELGTSRILALFAFLCFLVSCATPEPKILLRNRELYGVCCDCGEKGDLYANMPCGHTNLCGKCCRKSIRCLDCQDVITARILVVH